MKQLFYFNDFYPKMVGSFLGGGGGMSEDGWNTLGMSGRPSRYTVDTTKLKGAKDEPKLRLGNAGQFRDWGAGANVKFKNANKRNIRVVSGPPYSSNIYAPPDPSSEDGKRLPPPLSRYRPILDHRNNVI
jgi:hypothetical protein